MTSAPSSRNRITVTQYSRSSKPSATRTTIFLPLSFTSLLSLKLPSMLSLFRGPTSSFLLGHLHRATRPLSPRSLASLSGPHGSRHPSALQVSPVQSDYSERQIE